MNISPDLKEPQSQECMYSIYRLSVLMDFPGLGKPAEYYLVYLYFVYEQTFQSTFLEQFFFLEHYKIYDWFLTI